MPIVADSSQNYLQGLIRASSLITMHFDVDNKSVILVILVLTKSKNIKYHQR